MNYRCFLLAFLVGALGCQEDAIHTQRVPKPEPVTLRTLAALVQRPDSVWYFKLSGPADLVAADEEKFHGFLNSVMFDDDPPVRFATPEEWRIDPGGGKTAGGMTIPRFATLRTPNGNEAIITPLGPQSGDVLRNVNRWRGEVGLPPIAEAELPKVTKEITVGNTKAIWVDVRGDGKATSAPAWPTAMPQTAKQSIAYDKPAGWQPLPLSSFRVAAFRVGEGNESAEVTVSKLGGQSGSVADNVNRWRGQVQLEPLDKAKLEETFKEIQVEGKPCVYVNLIGPKDQGIFAVIVPRGEATWFVKMMGHGEIVKKNQTAFETFVRSLKLPTGE